MNNEKALQQLAWAIENSTGKFKLILARCNYASLRSRLIDRLQAICQVEISVLLLRESRRTLYAEIREEFGEVVPAALMIFGFESVQELPQMLVNANQVREEFRKHFSFPLIWWINDQVYKQLMDFAPDLESWGTSKNFVIAKDELANDLQKIANSWFSNNLSFTEDDYFRLKSELAAAQRDLLNDENFDNWQLEADLESLWGLVEKVTNKKYAAIKHYQKALYLWRKFNNSGLNNSELTFRIGENTNSEQHTNEFEEQENKFIKQTPPTHLIKGNEDGSNINSSFDDDITLEHELLQNQVPQNPLIPKKSIEHQLERQAKILAEICICYYSQAIKHADKNHSFWRATKNYVQEYLSFISHHHRADLIENYSINIGKILRDLQEWEALIKVFSRASKRHKSENKLIHLARDYGFLAEAALGIKNWQEAHSYIRKSLSILSELWFLYSNLETTSPKTISLIIKMRWSLAKSDYMSMALKNDLIYYLFILANIQFHLGDKSEAIINLEVAKELGSPLEDSRLYLDISKKLQTLYFDSKEYLKAYDIKLEIFSIEQQFGWRAFIGAGRLRSSKGIACNTEYSNLSEKFQENIQEKIAPEIAASTRQLDVEKIIERLGRNDCKLIVIYGQSGVGKSSLVNAGIEAALKNKAIGFKENLPITMRFYNHWEEELVKQISNNINLRNINPRNINPRNTNPRNTNPRNTNHKNTNPKNTNTENIIIKKTIIRNEITVDTSNHVSNCFFLNAILQQLAANEQRNIRTVLIFDQFEEFFFVCTESTQRRKFFEFLAKCLNILSVKVILSLRVDYLHYLLECNKLPSMKIISNDILSNNILYELGNFTPSDARSIIQRLTDNANFPLESALIDKLVKDLAGTLGEVRPIELQIVGAQLQFENINTLAKYHLLGDRAKEELVKRYLQAVVENCGAENIQIAELLLYSLTDQEGTRPLKTRMELEKSLEELERDVEKLERDLQEFVITPSTLSQTLDLVLEILVKSGLVLLFPEQPDDRYQLVHDYIATFIRQQQAPKLKVVMEELHREKEQRKVSEDKLNKSLVLLAVTMSNYAQQLNEQKQQSDINQIKALIYSSEVLFTSGETYDALIAALKAAEKIKQGEGVTADNQSQIEAVLRQAVYSNDLFIEQKTLSGHRDVVWDVAWCPINPASTEGIGKVHILASASSDKTIKLWNATTGKSLITLIGHSDVVWSVAWIPLSAASPEEIDKINILASASRDNTIKIWDINTGKPLKTLIGHSDGVHDVAWSPVSIKSPEGIDRIKILASASSDKTIKIWNATTGKAIKTLTGHSDVVWGVAWSADGKILASASMDKTIKLWDPNTGDLLKTLTGHRHGIIDLAWILVSTPSPEGTNKILASASMDKTIKLWDATTGKLLKTLSGHRHGVTGVTWSPVSANSPEGISKTLASASYENSIKLWDAIAGKTLKTLIGNSNGTNGVAWNPDGKTLASASRDSTIKLWDNATIDQPIKILIGHMGRVYDVAWSPDGKILASASRDNTIKLWDTTTGKLIKTLIGHSDWVYGVAWSRVSATSRKGISQILASTSRDKTIKLWDTSTGKLLKTLSGHRHGVWAMAWSMDGKTLASASWGNTVKLWDTTTGKFVRNLTGHIDDVNGVAWSPNGKTLASGSADKTIKLWDAITGKLLKTLTGHRSVVNGVAWSSDSTILASASWDHMIKLWDTTTGKLLKTLTGHNDAVWSVAWSADSKTLASASKDKTIKLWDVTTGKLLKILTLTGHSDLVIGVAWSPDGKTLASASVDKTIILWDFNFDNLVKSACSRLENYLTLHPEELANLKICQTPSILARAAEVLMLQGEEEAKNGDIENAIEKFRAAQRWNKQFDFDPEDKARELEREGWGNDF